MKLQTFVSHNVTETCPLAIGKCKYLFQKEVIELEKKFQKEATSSSLKILKKHCVTVCNKKRDLDRIESVISIAKHEKETMKFV